MLQTGAGHHVGPGQARVGTAGAGHIVLVKVGRCAGRGAVPHPAASTHRGTRGGEAPLISTLLSRVLFAGKLRLAE